MRRLTDLGQFKAGSRVLQIVRVQQLEDRHAGDLRLRPSKDGLPRWIGRLEIALGVEGPEQIGTQLPGQAARLSALNNPAFKVGIEFAEPGFRGPKCVLRRVALGNVDTFDEDRRDLAEFVSNWLIDEIQKAGF